MKATAFFTIAVASSLVALSPADAAPVTTNAAAAATKSDFQGSFLMGFLPGPDPDRYWGLMISKRRNKKFFINNRLSGLLQDTAPRRGVTPASWAAASARRPAAAT